jgi:hypothetical protein
MKRFLLVCAFFPLCLSAAFTGQWRTTVKAVSASTHQPQTVAIYVTLTQTSTGFTGTAATSGTLESIQNVVVSGAQIAFSITDNTGTSSFALTDLGSTLGGTVTLSTGQIVPVTLTALK